MTTDPEFLALWPTVLMKRMLSGHTEHDRALMDLASELEKRNRSLTTDYRDVDLFAMDHPAVNWLRDGVQNSIIAYLKGIGMDYALHWTLQGWININRLGDYHDLHNHPRSYLSGTYYVKVPDDKTALNNRADLRPGCITFYDPRGPVNMTAIKKDPNVDPEHTVRPEPGLLMLWPSFLNHFVHPNLSKATRISISFNVMLKWSDDYLPGQG